MSTDYSRENKDWVQYRVAHGILIEDGKILLVGNEWYKGEKLVYTLPGGRAEPGEGLQDALTREFREETGLDVAVGSLAYVVEARTAIRKYQFLTLAFVVTRQGGELSFTNDPNVRDVRFAPINEVETLIPSPSLGAALRDWLAHRDEQVRYWYFPEYANE